MSASRSVGVDLARQFMVPDRAIADASIPWVALTDDVEYKPLRFDFTSGVWVNLLRIRPGARLSRHRHNGGPVLGYCLEGSWRYLERDWEAVPGTFIYEPPGDVHTLLAGPEGMTTLFVTDGVLQYFDAGDRVEHEDNVFTRYDGYLRHCERHGIEVADLVY
jgi:quercetin dioxygenase-like cupin family protein